MSPASWEVRREERVRSQRFKGLVKDLPIESMTTLAFKEEVERLYVKVYYEEE